MRLLQFFVFTGIIQIRTANEGVCDISSFDALHLMNLITWGWSGFRPCSAAWCRWSICRAYPRV